MLLVLVSLVVLTGLASGCWAWNSYRSIERVAVADTLSSGGSGFTNVLLVGTDSRAGIDEDNPNAGAILGEGAPDGSRTDTIVVLQLRSDGADVVSLPRDLWVQRSDTGEFGRINAAYQSGPENLIGTVQESLGLPIHRYMEVDFAGFLDLVDAVGGITVDFPNPAFDNRSGLLVLESGPVELNGDAALAFVRSRAYTEVIDGVQVTDPTGDLGRVVRQQKFLRALFAKLESVRGPLTLNRVASAVGNAVKVDDGMGFVDAVGLFRRVRGLDPAPNVLPTVPRTTSGGAAILELNPDAAQAVLEKFGATG